MIRQLVDTTTGTVVLESRYLDLLVHAKALQFFPLHFSIQRKA